MLKSQFNRSENTVIPNGDIEMTAHEVNGERSYYVKDIEGIAKEEFVRLLQIARKSIIASSILSMSNK